MSQIKADCGFAKRLLLSSLVLLFFALQIFQVPVLHAAPKTTITVGSLLDSGGLCTLRNAILAANTNTPQGACTAGSSGTDAIGFSVSGIITLTSALPTITDTLTIDGGNSITVSGDSNYQIITIDPGVAVSLTNISIQKGRTSGDGGAILNNGILKIDHASFISNTSTGGKGGAIFNNVGGILTVTNNSTFSLNRSASYGGAIDNDGTSLYVANSAFNNNATTSTGGGGAIDNDNTLLTILNSTFTNNTAVSQNAGAVWMFITTGVISNSAFSNNVATAGGHGGGLVVDSGSSVNITNSSFNGNSAAQDGGGIYILGGTAAITNTTLSGNIANNNGGGIHINSGTATLNNVTVASNIADNDGNGSGDGGGILNNTGTVNTKNTIIANNRDNGGEAPDCNGTLTTQNNNLLGNNTNCAGLTNGVNGDKVGTGSSPLNPKLGGPAYYGGSTTLIQILLPGSPALDAGNNSTCATTDQRGAARPVNFICDMGAYEGVGYGLYLPLVSK